MIKLKPLLFLLLASFLLIGCSPTYNPNIEADEAMPQMEDDASTSKSNY